MSEWAGVGAFSRTPKGKGVNAVEENRPAGPSIEWPSGFQPSAGCSIPPIRVGARRLGWGGAVIQRGVLTAG